MTKNNEYVGVDEQFIPEEEKTKQHVSESIIGDETRDKIKGGIRKGTDYLTSDEGKEKVKNVAGKGLKVAKGIGIGYLVWIGVGALVAIAVFVLAFVIIGKAMNRQNQMLNNFDEVRDSLMQDFEETTDKMRQMQDKFLDSSNN